MRKNNRMLDRGQAGLEYLMTYGWALVIVVIIVSALVFLVGSPQGTASCSSFDHFLVKGVMADTEKIQLVVQNITGGKVTGLDVYAGIYTTTDSPPLFQINVGDATVGGTKNSASLSNDYVINFIDGYKDPLGTGIEKTAIIPWPVSGFGFPGSEFGEDGCLFLTNSLGKQFNVTITAYYRDQFGLVRQETAKCTGTIEEAEIIDFPPEAWGC